MNINLTSTEVHILLDALDTGITKHYIIAQKIRSAYIDETLQAINEYVNDERHAEPCPFCDDTGAEDWCGLSLVKCRSGCNG